MVRRDDTKTQALAASRTLNPRPEKVTDPAFGPGGFFDPADLVQVKYEMVRRAEAADVPASRAAADFGFSRQSLYSARAALRERGLAGLVPAKPGPKGGHKLTGQVVDLLEDLLEADPGLRPADLAAAVRERFGVSVHPRSVERALQRRRTARREDEQSGEQAPGAAPKSLTSPAPSTRTSPPVMTAAHSPSGMSSCAVPRPPGAADGGTAWACCSPRGWPPGWPRGPPCPPRPGRGPNPAATQQRHRRPARPCPPLPRPRPLRAAKEVMPARRPARRCCPRSRLMPPARSSRCWRR